MNNIQAFEDGHEDLLDDNRQRSQVVSAEASCQCLLPDPFRANAGSVKGGIYE